jgi:UDP-glucose 4-epimerase|tara:strand:- start:7335 stop:8252 length:918 start_codon:yes stop_codon:yes gene_type:complete
MKVLVTGVAGFIGSNLSRKLIENNIDVIGIDNLSYGVKSQIPSGVKFFQEDIRDKQISGLFDRVDYVFHLAAKNSLIDCENNPAETHDINVNGTKNIFNISINKGVKKVIYAESSAVYEGVEALPSVETTTYPKSIYAKSKMETNTIAQQLFISKGLFATGLRYFNVYGPHQDYRRTIPPVFSAFIIKMLQGERPTIYGDGSKKRDFVYVDDVNDFHLMCMQNKLTDNNIYNIGSGKNYSIKSIYERIKSILNSDIKPIYGENFDFEAQDTLANIDQAKKIGWEPKTSISIGLKKSIDYIKENVI